MSERVREKEGEVVSKKKKKKKEREKKKKKKKKKEREREREMRSAMLNSGRTGPIPRARPGQVTVTYCMEPICYYPMLEGGFTH